MTSRHLLIAVAIFAVALAVRMPGIDLPYWQDEGDWVHAAETPDSTIPHPPLGEWFYEHAADMFGPERLRAFTVLASLATLAMLMLVVGRRAGTRSALWAGALFAGSFYAVLSSLVIDTDGQLMPLAFLGMVYGYDRWRSASGPRQWAWLLLALACATAGFYLKTVFAIAVASVFIDYAFAQPERWRMPRFWLLWALAGAAVLAWFAVSLRHAALVFPDWSYEFMRSYTSRFALGGFRSMQVAIQWIKGLLYLSPLLLGMSLLLGRERIRRNVVFIAYAVLVVLVYGVVFDFSAGAVDRYLMALAVPFCALAGIALSDVVRQPSRPAWVVGALAAAAFLALQFMPHDVVPLYPKEAWFGRVVAGHWLFLMPFFGGSGPAGFYISWASLGLAWGVSGAALLGVLLRKVRAADAAIVMLLVGVAYNGLFIEEYLAGRIHGSPVVLLRRALAVIRSDAGIKEVITYNDAGFRELQAMGKYRRRLYVAPKFERSYDTILATYNGHWLVIDLPLISEDSPYTAYFAGCTTRWMERDGAVTARILLCTPQQ